jgi:translation initiation factor IF-2
VRKEPRASATAEREKVDINLYDVIYEAVDELKLAIEGLLKPEEVQHVTGRADVRQVFRIPRLGAIAGSYVSSGTAARTARARVIRGEETVFDGRVASLRRFKDDVKEVEAGLECGIGLEGFDAMQEGDVIEFYETEQILRKIS